MGYKTADGVKVKATFHETDVPEGTDAVAPVWVVEFPDGAVRYVHPNAFADNFGED